MRIGITSIATSVSCHDRKMRSTNENVISRPAVTNWRRPHCTSSDIDSMSAVMRAISTPDLWRSKKPSDCFWMCPNTLTRSSRRNPSPARLTKMNCWRDATYDIATTKKYPITALRRTPRSSASIPLSMP